jgi:hypothetical protein
MWIAYHRSTGNIVTPTFKKKSEARRYIYEKTWQTAMFDYKRIRKEQLKQWQSWIKLGLR